MPPLSLLIKPASGSCNMRCSYCFYADETANRKVASYGLMSDETLENVVKTALEKATVYCTFAFQGGEPTLAGLEYFEKLVLLVEKYNKKKITINYCIQTNGLLIDRDWVSFFRRNNFLVGLSLDGTKDVNDLFRKDSDGEGSYSRIIRVTQLLESGGVNFNILTVATYQLAKRISKVYGFYIRSRFFHLQFIPCLDPLGEKRGKHGYSLKPEVYGKFLCDLFALWYRDIMNGKNVSIRWFDNLITMIKGSPPETCGMAGYCGMQYVVEADGGVYPCDFYALDQYRLGHISDGFEALDKSRTEMSFVEDSLPVASDCKECKWYYLCRGGCRRDRDIFDDGKLPLNYYCVAYKQFFDSCYDRLAKIAVEHF